MRREAARSAGPKLMPCMRGEAAAISSTLVDAERGLEDRVDEDRPLEPGLRLELRQQAVDVVDVPRRPRPSGP